MINKGKIIALPYTVGDTIKWRCDDDGKVHTTKVTSITIEIDANNHIEYTYGTIVKWKRQKAVAFVEESDIIQ